MNDPYEKQRRLLDAARVLGAVAVAMLGLFAIDMSGGYLGARDELTYVEGIYGGLLIVVTTAGLVGLLRSIRGSGLLLATTLAVNAGIFVPALIFDPLKAGVVIIWQIVMLARHFLPIEVMTPLTQHRLLANADEALRGWYRDYGPAFRHLVLASGGITTAVVGFELSERPFVLGLCVALNLIAMAAATHFLLLAARHTSRLFLLALAPLAAALVFVAQPQVALSLVVLSELAVLFVLVKEGPFYSEVLNGFLEKPAILTMSVFLGVIAVGTLFLSFPAASATGTAISLTDALFTATSATCVTGLIVLDTPAAFSTFGHVVILTLIQIGGLGIMVLSTFATVLIGGKLGLRGEQALGEALDIRNTRSAYRLAMFIVWATLAIEAAGACLLTVSYWRHGFGWAEAAWRGVFHAVSAFCNAGFALQSDSIVMFQDDPFAIGIFSGLILLGGIGFLVMAAMWDWATRKRRRPPTLQFKVVILMTAVLLFGGWAIYLALEWNASLAGLDPAAKVYNAFFQSVTLRTAGFNSVDFGPLESATLLFMMVFMFIGASPGSTGGGIKTTTALVMLAAVRAIAKGHEAKVEMFRRRIPQAIVFRALAVVLIGALVVVGGLFALLTAEDIAFESLLFEAVSAFGTVGLSIGATGELTTPGKLIVIIMMYIGRVGPLALALLLGGGKPSPIDYPRAKIMVW